MVLASIRLEWQRQGTRKRARMQVQDAKGERVWEGEGRGGVA